MKTQRSTLYIIQLLITWIVESIQSVQTSVEAHKTMQLLILLLWKKTRKKSQFALTFRRIIFATRWSHLSEFKICSLESESYIKVAAMNIQCCSQVLKPGFH